MDSEVCGFTFPQDLYIRLSRNLNYFGKNTVNGNGRNIVQVIAGDIKNIHNVSGLIFNLTGGKNRINRQIIIIIIRYNRIKIMCLCSFIKRKGGFNTPGRYKFEMTRISIRLKGNLNIFSCHHVFTENNIKVNTFANILIFGVSSFIGGNF